MLEYISDSKCWKTITDFVNLKKKEDKEYALKVFILILVVLLIIYFYYDEIKKMVKTSCKALEIPIDTIYNVENYIVDSMSGTSLTPVKF